MENEKFKRDGLKEKYENVRLFILVFSWINYDANMYDGLSSTKMS